MIFQAVETMEFLTEEDQETTADQLLNFFDSSSEL